MADNTQDKDARKKHSPFVKFLINLVKGKPLGTIGAVITLLLLFTGIFADFLAPFGMNDVNMEDRLLAPSAKYWLGTDNVGRDLFSRVIYGARVSVIVGLAASIIATVLSLAIGLLSGYIGGAFDLILQRFVDGAMCIPAIILLMVIISMIGPGIGSIIISLGLLWGVIGSRIIRSAVIGIKENAYVEAAKTIGCLRTRILVRHILPNIMAPTIILFTTRVPNVILTEAALSVLGFGIPPPIPSWGGMLSNEGRAYMFMSPWLVVWPGLALSIVVYGVNMFGDAVRDLLDPKLKGGAGRYGV